MSIAEARIVCPDLVLVEGEDLSPFRDVSKQLYSLLRAYSWSGQVERLGLDEVFMDVTDIVTYNVSLFNPHGDLSRSFFHLSSQDPERGFTFDGTAIAGCVDGLAVAVAVAVAVDGSNPPYHLQRLLASHLARYLRLQIEEQGYTCACGISSNKVLSKLAGSRHKPRNQTTLLGLPEADILAFMDAHHLRKVPGIGAKTTRLLEGHVLAREVEVVDPGSVTVGEVRALPHMSAALLEKLLGGPGAERGVGERVWGLLHGVDNSEVKAASDVPSQISIEDTYQGLNALSEITAELKKLSASLLRRMHADLLVDHDDKVATADQRRWLAHPRTLRLTTRPKTERGDGKPYGFNRASRSQPLPTLLFNLSTPGEWLVEKLVSDHLLPMFHKLNPGSGGWNVGLLNVCVTNMVPTGADDRASSGRDISTMFRRQEDVLREFRVYDLAPPSEGLDLQDRWVADEGEEDLIEYDRDSLESCPLCGHPIPAFAIAAHETYHALGE